MRIVPEDSGLEIEAYVRNRDIGFVSVGQEAAVKVESFPYTRYGAIHAHVVRIAKDAIPEPDAEAIEGDPARVSAAAGFAGSERTRTWCSRSCSSRTSRRSRSTASRSRSPRAWRSRSS
jgi:hemolysin D